MHSRLCSMKLPGPGSVCRSAQSIFVRLSSRRGESVISAFQFLLNGSYWNMWMFVREYDDVMDSVSCTLRPEQHLKCCQFVFCRQIWSLNDFHSTVFCVTSLLFEIVLCPYRARCLSLFLCAVFVIGTCCRGNIRCRRWITIILLAPVTQVHSPNSNLYSSITWYHNSCNCITLLQR